MTYNRIVVLLRARVKGFRAGEALAREFFECEFQVAPQQPGTGICRVFSGNLAATQVAVQHPSRGGVSTFLPLPKAALACPTSAIGPPVLSAGGLGRLESQI